jgi:hypothetical protein
MIVPLLDLVNGDNELAQFEAVRFVFLHASFLRLFRSSTSSTAVTSSPGLRRVFCVFKDWFEAGFLCASCVFLKIVWVLDLVHSDDRLAPFRAGSS